MINIYIVIIILIILSIIIMNKILGKEHFTNQDSDKQRKFKECLSDMNNILNENNQEFFLVYGTFLGQQRENQFIEHDNDIDIGIFRDKFNPDIKNKILNSKKFTFLHDFGKLEDSYECTFTHINGISIDIFIHYLMKDNYYYTTSFTGICDSKNTGYCKWGHHIDGLKKIKFMDEKYNIPTNTQSYLEEIYGKDYMTPKKFNYYEGLNEGNYKSLIN